MAIRIDEALDGTYEQFKVQVERLDSRCQGAIDEMAASTVDSESIISLYRYLTNAKTRLNNFASIPGVVQYVKDAEDDQTYDISTEITAVTSAITDTQSWIETSFPSSGGYLLFLRIIDSVITPRSFTPANTAGLRTELAVITGLIGS